MDIKEILREFTRRGPSYMPYHDEEGLLYIIWYLDNYHPYRQQGRKNWRFDQASSVMLRFKQGQPEAIGYYLLKILGKFGRHEKYRKVIEGGNLRFAVVPGHEAGQDESSVHKLARMLSAYYGRADYSRCLRRKHNMAKLSTGGNRSLLKQYQSMEVDDSYTVSGKKFLLLDDIVTTGNSLIAARKRLLEAGATEVYPLAMAQTVLEPETPFSNKEARYNPVNMDDIVTLVDERYYQKLKVWEDTL